MKTLFLSYPVQTWPFFTHRRQSGLVSHHGRDISLKYILWSIEYSHLAFNFRRQQVLHLVDVKGTPLMLNQYASRCTTTECIIDIYVD